MHRTGALGEKGSQMRHINCTATATVIPAIAALAIICLPSYSSAYVFRTVGNGAEVRWNTNNIHIVLDQSLQLLGPLDEVENTVMSAFDEWVDTAELPVEFSFEFGKCKRSGNGGKKKSENCVLAGTEYFEDKGPVGATTFVSYSAGSGDIANGDILINAAQNMWNIHNEAGTYNLKNAILHEVGHFLGLAHSEIEEARMAPTLQATMDEVKESTVLHVDDIEGATVLYEDMEPFQPMSCSTVNVGNSPASCWFLVLLGVCLVVRRNRKTSTQIIESSQKTTLNLTGPDSEFHADNQRPYDYYNLPTVVIVSSDKEAANAARRYLEASGITVIVTGSVFMTFQILQAMRVVAVIVDEEFEAGTGVSLCNRINDVLGNNAPHLVLLSSKENTPETTQGITSTLLGVVDKSEPVKKLVSLMSSLVQKLGFPVADMVRPFTVRETDPLTGVNVRTYFEMRLDSEWAEACCTMNPIAVLMITPDNCPKLRSDNGDETMDQILAQAAKIIEGELRSSDCVARYNRDTFAVILTETDGSQGRTKATQICSALNGLMAGTVDQPIKVTFSVGIVDLLNAMSTSPKELLETSSQRVKNAMVTGGQCVYDGNRRWAA